MKKIPIFILLVFSLNSFGQLTFVNVGASANSGTGDPLRTAFIKINLALAELNRIGIQSIMTTPEELNILHNLDLNTKSASTIETIPTIYSAAGDTSNYPVPGKIGNIFINTSDGDVYVSIKAIRHDGWVKLN
jgi:hypothetical protein